MLVTAAKYAVRVSAGLHLWTPTRTARRHADGHQTAAHAPSAAAAAAAAAAVVAEVSAPRD